MTEVTIGAITAVLILLGLMAGGYKTLSGRIDEVFQKIEKRKVEKETLNEVIRRFEERLDRYDHYFEKLFNKYEEQAEAIAEINTKLKNLELWIMKNNGRLASLNMK